MNRFGMSFHHLGLAVKEPRAAMDFLEGLGYRLADPVLDAEQNVNAIMASHESMPVVEILWSTGAGGPLERMLERHPKGLTYHVCFAADKLSDSLDRIAAAGLQAVCVSPPKKAIQFDGKSVSFYAISHFGLVEIMHD